MTVSALIRARDEVDGIGPLLDELRRQTLPVEVVVIDSGSTDGTVASARARGVEPLHLEPGSFPPVRRVPARAAMREWWLGPHAHVSPLQARLDPRRAAMLAGKWAALR